MVDRLAANGRRVRVVDNFQTGSRGNLSQHDDNPDIEIVEADIGERDQDVDLFDGAERVFHFAGLADIVPSIENPEAYFRANVDGTFNVLQAAARAGAKRFLYAASSTCYGIPDRYPTPEDAPARPQYPYALTKYLGEQLVMHWSQVYKLPAISLRMFNVFGPRARTGGSYGAVFGVFLAQLLAGKPLTIVGDGTQTRDFTFVTDVVDAFLCAADSNVAGETLNIGSGNTYSVNRLVELLGNCETVHVPKRPGEPHCTWADTSRIEALLNWRAKISFERGVEIMLENIEAWRGAPVWTNASIAEATKDWFRYLAK